MDYYALHWGLLQKVTFAVKIKTENMLVLKKNLISVCNMYQNFDLTHYWNLYFWWFNFLYFPEYALKLAFEKKFISKYLSKIYWAFWRIEKGWFDFDWNFTNLTLALQWEFYRGQLCSFQNSILLSVYKMHELMSSLCGTCSVIQSNLFYGKHERFYNDTAKCSSRLKLYF